MASSEYPNKDTVRRGAILHSIANGIMVAQCPGYGRYLYWDDINYVLNGADGTYGVVSFYRGCIVGAFFDVHSTYNPIGSEEQYDINHFFRGMPPRYRSLVDAQTLRYNKQNYHGEVVPLVTAAFWDQGECLTAAFPWDEVFKNGAHIIRVELIEDVNAALKEWQDAYDMSSKQVALTRSLFERKMTEPDRTIELSRSEVEWLASLSQEPEAMEDCRRALLAIGIRVP